ncbi:MAG TPA: hypothetical protein VFK92_15700 [Burkholderiales bacterium]|nr:hypothetical protein [Burkholderiales bacterium]
MTRSKAVLALGIIGTSLAFGQVAIADEGSDMSTLVQGLGKSKQTLLGGMRQAVHDKAAVISAKFEMEDGKLSLSVYTAEKGLAVPAEENVLQELSGSPEQDKWTPQTEVFKDVPHVARSAEQLTLMALAHKSLPALVAEVQKKEAARVFSVTPAVKNHRPVAVILVVQHGKVKTLVRPL